MRDVFARYNFQSIRTPIFEDTQLFSRSVGEETDIVSKEMFTWEDRARAASEKAQSLTLRPENTAGVVRAYIEHGFDKRGTLQKLYYIGRSSGASVRRRAVIASSFRLAQRSSGRRARAASLPRAMPKCWRCSPPCSTRSACATGVCS